MDKQRTLCGPQRHGTKTNILIMMTLSVPTIWQQMPSANSRNVLHRQKNNTTSTRKPTNTHAQTHFQEQPPPHFAQAALHTPRRGYAQHTEIRRGGASHRHGVLDNGPNYVYTYYVLRSNTLLGPPLRTMFAPLCESLAPANEKPLLFMKSVLAPRGQTLVNSTSGARRERAGSAACTFRIVKNTL